MVARISTFSGGLGRVFRRAHREEEIGQPVFLAAELRVAERDGAACPRRDRKDVRAEQARAQPFQQRRVAVSPHDFLVHPPGFLGVQQLGGHFLAVDHERHLVDRAVVGQRKDERRFDRPTAAVDERLRHLHLGHLVDQPRMDAELLDPVADLRRWRHDRAVRMRIVARPDPDRPRQPHRRRLVLDNQQPLCPGHRRPKAQQ